MITIKQIIAAAMVAVPTIVSAADRTSQYTCEDVRRANATWSKAQKAKALLSMTVSEIRSARACLSEKPDQVATTSRCWSEQCS